MTADVRFRDGWVIDGEYTLLQDVFLITGPSALIPQVGFGLPTVAQWKANPHGYEDWIVGPVYAGTHLRFTKLMWSKSIDVDEIHAYAKILDGEFAGREVFTGPIDKHDLSFPGPGLPQPESINPEFLRLVSPESVK